VTQPKVVQLCDNCRKVELTAESRDPDYPLLCRSCGQRLRVVRGEVHDFVAVTMVALPIL